MQWIKRLLVQISHPVNKTLVSAGIRSIYNSSANIQNHVLKKEHMKKYTAFVPVYETQEDKIQKALPIVRVVINWQ